LFLFLVKFWSLCYLSHVEFTEWIIVSNWKSCRHQLGIWWSQMQFYLATCSGASKTDICNRQKYFNWTEERVVKLQKQKFREILSITIIICNFSCHIRLDLTRLQLIPLFLPTDVQLFHFLWNSVIRYPHIHSIEGMFSTLSYCTPILIGPTSFIEWYLVIFSITF